MDDFDLVIVGSGPAGMWCGYEANLINPKLKIAILEKGPIRPPTKPEESETLKSGWGGSGTFSDGKIDLTPKVGGQLESLLGSQRFTELMEYIDGLYIKFGGNKRLVDPTASEHKESVETLIKQASRVGLEIVPFPIRHLGTDKVYIISEKIRHHLEGGGVKIFVNTQVTQINRPDSLFAIEAVNPVSGEERTFMAKNVVVAPGRSGMEEWFMEEMRRLGIPYKVGGVDVGVRIETKAKTMKAITDIFHEIKIYYQTPKYKDRARTFCMCPNGLVVMEEYRGLTIVNGHSYDRTKKGHRSVNTNFAVLVTQHFTEPFNNPIAYGRGIVQQANELAGGKILVQKLGDIWRGGRSRASDVPNWKIKPTLKDAVPGDITLGGIPPRHLEGVLQMLRAMDEICPGINSAHTLLYVPEVKFYSVQVQADPKNGFETVIPGLFVIGDGAGRTRGLLQSSMEGIITARAITGNTR